MFIKPHNPIFFFSAIILGLLLLHNANAQTFPSFSIDTDPLPLFAGDTAVVKIRPANFSLASTTIQWYVNDVFKTSLSGIGKGSIIIKTISGKQEIFRIKVIVDPGPGFEKVERQTLVATILLFPSTEQLLKETNKVRAEFKIIVSPSEPSPGQTVHLNTEAVGFNINTAKIQWFINDKQVLSGIGEKSFEFQAGKLGDTHRVRVDITLLDGTTNSKTEIIRVNNLSFYWWTDAVVPLWYKGKSLPSIHSKVTILALPEIAGVASNNLVYNWEFNGGPVLSKSGFNKSTYSFTPQFDGIRETITVRAANISGANKKEKSILVGAVTPAVQLYQIKPLEGIDYYRSINFLEAAPASILDFIAELFFFPPTAQSDISYQWQLGGRDVPSKEPASPNIISIRSGGGQIPEQFVQLNVENKKIKNGGTISNSFRLRYR